jgi:hypothetical protein
MLMSEVSQKLAALLDYWLEHNREHEAEFRDWADKAAPVSGDVAGQLRLAADSMAEANKCLEKAQQALDKAKS